MSEEQKNNEEKTATPEASNENNAPKEEAKITPTHEEKPKETAETKKDAEEPQEKKNKKINVMTLKELEQAIEKTKKNQGGLYSRYAYELIKRKNFLDNNKKK